MPWGIDGGFHAHPGLQWLGATPQGASWLAGLDHLAETLAAELHLTLVRAYDHAHCGISILAATDDAALVVLKLCAPDDEGLSEAAALKAWGATGAVRLVDERPFERALLLEAIVPGNALRHEDPEQALSVLCDSAQRLTIAPTADIVAFAPVARRWHDHITGWRDQATEVVGRDVAAETLELLVSAFDENWLVNLDLQATNVLWSESRGWLVIDPKEVAGP